MNDTFTVQRKFDREARIEYDRLRDEAFQNNPFKIVLEYKRKMYYYNVVDGLVYSGYAGAYKLVKPTFKYYKLVLEKGKEKERNRLDNGKKPL